MCHGRAAQQRVLPAKTEHVIIAGAAIEQVVCVSADENVVAISAKQRDRDRDSIVCLISIKVGIKGLNNVASAHSVDIDGMNLRGRKAKRFLVNDRFVEIFDGCVSPAADVARRKINMNVIGVIRAGDREYAVDNFRRQKPARFE